MTVQRMVELLEIEHECMLRGSHGDCELVQDDDELHEMYTDVIEIVRKQIPMKPTWQNGKAYCGSCGKRIPGKIKAYYCHKCGQKVGWE